MDELKVVIDGDISAEEIEKLRTAVGWEANTGEYAKALNQTYTHFSIKQNSTLIAFSRVISDGEIYAFIVDLLVHPDYQHHGIGKHILKHTVNALKKDNIKYIQLTFDSKLEDFYKNQGFTVIEAGSIKNY